MIKIFPIDFIRQALEQTLLEEHLKNANYFGGTDQINIFSFYEQLKGQDEVDRFVENYRDLTNQQNRSGLIGNGVLLAPENPSITNLYSSTIIPMVWSCSIRCKLRNRDQMIETLNNLIEKLKGRKVDIAQLKCDDENGKDYYVPFKVGTISQNVSATTLKNGDYIGEIATTNDVSTILTSLYSKGVTFNVTNAYWFYVDYEGILSVVKWDATNSAWVLLVDDGTYNDIVFPPEHTSFEKYKLSLSFDALRCDEPRTLNSEEYCELSFSGSATIVSKGVALGNDLLKISISKYKIEGNPDIPYNTNITYLEPLELPSGNNLSSQVNQLMSAKFLTKPHTDSMTPTIQYTFICDLDNPLLKVWFDFARYGTWSLEGNDVSKQLSPNTKYQVNEKWCSWGEFNSTTYYGKIVENIDIENTESDALTISVSFQVIGDN